MGRGRDDEPWVGRESIFRKKLNELRTTGRIELPKAETVNRIKELEQSTYLNNVAYQTAQAGGDERVALLDGLTELYNYATITRILGDELKRGRRYKYPSCVIAVTPDKLEEVRLTNGPLAVDGIYKGTANFLMSTIRDVDIPSRYSSDTFLVICPNTPLEGGAVLAERVRNNICQSRISDIGQNWAVTASIGVAEFPAMAQTVDDLINVLGAALQQAKDAGGDRVVLAQVATA
ncbi:MAG TPA: GGDEF domain-containing protein [Oculatellaceae cyanobacterium]